MTVGCVWSMCTKAVNRWTPVCVCFTPWWCRMWLMFISCISSKFLSHLRQLRFTIADTVYHTHSLSHASWIRGSVFPIALHHVCSSIFYSISSHFHIPYAIVLWLGLFLTMCFANAEKKKLSLPNRMNDGSNQMEDGARVWDGANFCASDALQFI